LSHKHNNKGKKLQQIPLKFRGLIVTAYLFLAQAVC